MTHRTHESLKSFPAHERYAKACAALLVAAGIPALVGTHPDTGADWLHVYVRPAKVRQGRALLEAFCAGSRYEQNERIRSNMPELDLPNFWFAGESVSY